MPSDAAFREALMRAAKCMRDVARNLDHGGDVIAAVQTLTGGARIAEGDCARLLALYAEAQQQGERDQLALAEQVAEATVRMEQGRAERQGEEQVKTVMYGEAYVLRPRKDGAIILWPDGDYRVLRELKPGDRVRVVKEGT